jgi:glycine cleavage system aminomethyltransferase T
LKILTLDDPSRVVMGSEPVYDGDKSIGYVTSAAYGYSVGRGVVYAWLDPNRAELGTSLQIEYFGERLAATVAPDPLFDPKMERIRTRPPVAASPAPVLIPARGA